MKIQLLNSSKLKIFFNKTDLDENNISIHSFLARSPNSQKFIKAIIEIAYEDLGFKIENDSFTYEIYCSDFSEFIIIVSKNSNNLSYLCTPPNIFYNKKTDISRDTHTSKPFGFRFCHNELLNNKNLFFFFDNFEDFFTFSKYIRNNIKSPNINSSLYEYNNILLLEITTSNLSVDELRIFLSVLSECKSNSYPSRLTLIRFKEFAKILSSENALDL